jgi:hypothetical protein
MGRLEGLGRWLRWLRRGDRDLREIAGRERDLLEMQLAQGEALTKLQSQVETLAYRLRYLTEQVDLLKSSLELDPELPAEFERWKAAHPVPERPLVSVCVATFDRAETLVTRCIPSVLEQTYPHLELIVVGDGCTDDTAEAVARIRDPRLRFVNRPERGRYPEDPVRRWMVAGTPAMNEALSLARGDFVTHLDDDDKYLPDRLEKLVAFAREHGCDLVWHPFWAEEEDGRWTLNEAEELAWTRVTTSSVFYRSWFTRIPWDIEAHRLQEPGDWNRFRKMKYVGPLAMRYPEPLVWHSRERSRR